jgi:glycosyltransferase involved in cell wall biosynthesis
MHLDALVATANAIAGLREQGVAAQLVLHTDRPFWKAYESTWRDLGVENGGLIAHGLLEARLRDADLLLVVASFLPKQAPMSRSSVQTKLTDYMAAGTPIFGVGPPGAASLDFIEQWGVGLTCTSADPTDIAATLRNWMANPPDRETLAKRAHKVLKVEFDPDIVCRRLWQFVANIAVRPPPPGLGRGLAAMPPNAIA